VALRVSTRITGRRPMNEVAAGTVKHAGASLGITPGRKFIG
jgi:hypothetical protein